MPSIRKLWLQLDIKMGIVIRFPFYAFSVYVAIRRNAGTVYNESHLYSQNIFFFFSRNENVSNVFLERLGS
jgi:hypothetical protein